LDTSRQTKNLNKLLIRILLHLQVEFSDFGSKKEQYKSIFLEFFSEDFEWLDDNTHYIMRLKGNILSAPGNTFIEAGFSKYEVVEKLTEILQKYTNNPKIVELFQTINTDFQE